MLFHLATRLCFNKSSLFQEIQKMKPRCSMKSEMAPKWNVESDRLPNSGQHPGLAFLSSSHDQHATQFNITLETISLQNGAVKTVYKLFSQFNVHKCSRGLCCLCLIVWQCRSRMDDEAVFCMEDSYTDQCGSPIRDLGGSKPHTAIFRCIISLYTHPHHPLLKTIQKKKQKQDMWSTTSFAQGPNCISTYLTILELYWNVSHLCCCSYSHFCIPISAQSGPNCF